jgi:hypothetical protein
MGGGTIQAAIRIYLPDQGRDGTGWGPGSSPIGGRGLPTYDARLVDGTKLGPEDVVKQLARPLVGGTKQPVTAEQWEELVHAIGQ